MTKSEDQELVEYIALQFDRIGKRFDSMDERFDAVDERLDAVDVRLTRVEILGDESRHQMQIVAEAVSDTVSNAKFDAFRSEVAAGFEDLRGLLGASPMELDQRVRRLEEGAN